MTGNNRSHIGPRVLAAASAMVLSFGVAQPARAGPVKHWGMFPGREVRAVAIRGERFGGENRGQYRVDNRYLTSVVPAAGGGYWYAFAVPGAIGRVWPSGRAVLRRIPGLGPVNRIAAAGEDVYAADDRCQVAHVRDLVLLELRQYDCSQPYGYRLAVVNTSDGAIWILDAGGGTVERRGPRGERSRVTLPMSPMSVAVAHDGTAYVLGVPLAGRGAHPTIAVIAPGAAPQVRVLPMLDAATIAIDGRDRIWISDPTDHAFALITPTARHR
jgi:hypothetical protein